MEEVSDKTYGCAKNSPIVFFLSDNASTRTYHLPTPQTDKLATAIQRDP
jgi:hypothetical protein